MASISRLSGIAKMTLLAAGIAVTVCAAAGCGPTYPKERFKESIVDVCKKDYGLDVKADVSGKTIAIYLALPNLIDFTFSITKEAGDKINDVILSVSRVALSSDADFDFYCVIAHDTRIPEVQIIIIKSVNDVKRFLLNDISRGEYAKRMLIDMRFSPQAQKERAIKDVFDKMSLDSKWQEQVMDDFFRSEPAGLGDIGYWNDRFYIKDIALPEFLVEQIASRVKLEFRDDKRLADLFLVKSSKGSFLTSGGERVFKIEAYVDNKVVISYGAKTSVEAGGLQTMVGSDEVFKAVLKVANEVIHGYRFNGFDHVEIVNQKDSSVLKVPREKLEQYRLKKLKFEDLIKV
ncbi:MAG: hypothetical protein JW919_03855 [Candidatus Omnitrophica bacterium]|nr:hypothetical protein [Candidatus Omnitrophota bacterium]